MFPIETASKTFIDGDGTTELGTILPAWWLNQVQAEMLALLAAANILPAKEKLNQLVEAVKKISLDNIPNASGTVLGLTKINNTLTSLATTEALSANQGRLLDERKANKSSTLDGYGVLDWVVKSYSTGQASKAIGNGVHSYISVVDDAPRWEDGTGIGAFKMLQIGADTWDSQIAMQGYGECVFTRSRRSAGGPYQFWKRLDGGDWAASEKQSGYIANKPNVAKSHLPNGYARLTNGTIIQWGAVTVINGQANWIYPIAFPTAALQVYASQDGVVGVTYTVGASVDPTALKTQAKVTSTLTTGSDAFSCLAIGY